MLVVEARDVAKRYRIRENTRPTMREALGSLGRVSDRYWEHWALRDVSFTADEGEVVGLIGRNGAGKTTLLKILARITEPTAGIARMRGRIGALLEVGTGFHPELTGRENIFLNGSILGMKKREIRRQFDDIVEFAGVEKFIDTPVKRYSSGMYLRLAFSVAAHVDPDIVVVDEVLAVGDAEFQRKCLGKMSDFAREGRTVFFVSHDLGAIAQMCERVIWLEGGRIAHDGPTARSIDLYLSERSRDVQHVDFALDEEKEVQLLAVGLTDSDGRPIDAPTRDQAFAVRVRFLVRERVGPLDVGISLMTRRGVKVISENWADGARGTAADAPGTWEVSLVVPPVLAPNEYTVTVSIASPYESFVEEDVLSFRLWPNPEDRRELAERNRLLQVPMTWRHELRAPSADEAATQIETDDI